MESYCLEGHGDSSSPICTIDEILAKSPDALLTHQEMKLTTSLLRRPESHGVKLEARYATLIVVNSTDCNVKKLLVATHVRESLRAPGGLKYRFKGD